MSFTAELVESFGVGNNGPMLTMHHHFVYGEFEPFDIIHNLPLEGEHDLNSFLGQWMQKVQEDEFAPTAMGFTEYVTEKRRYRKNIFSQRPFRKYFVMPKDLLDLMVHDMGDWKKNDSQR